ncbi:hypothetical protein CCR94_09560 [Rhodoblastus sphagnicola]|uniref:Uncharacterized protein n=1 Tax=Rhodoblastus sphagnicola TaxID=333368 RepID=A0A2S6N9J2_9HYPH|nr:methyltransferase domain-containing protein [Rhodoblastus sphagnicola]MBB4200411.1 hypothetical protein [Rhodoblastus sphagnicola]PPQ31288.1 hypothetical protein CCR94_09560 [Rhodoblastus sphagnicola]
MTNIKKTLGSLIPYPAILAGRKVFHYGRRRCLVCASHYRSRLDSGYGFPVLEQLHVAGGLMRRADVCPICHSGSRERLIWFYLTKEWKLSDDARGRLRVAHFAPEKGLSQRLQQQFPDTYRAYDFAPQRYRHLRNVEFQDIQQLSLASASVDLLICNHVLEHVFDLSAALHEVRRVLSANGRAIMQTPIALKLDQMRDGGQRASPAERIALFGQHDHVRLFTRQGYIDALNAAGLSVTAYEPFQERSEEATAWELDPFETLFVISI